MKAIEGFLSISCLFCPVTVGEYLGTSPLSFTAPSPEQSAVARSTMDFLCYPGHLLSVALKKKIPSFLKSYRKYFELPRFLKFWQFPSKQLDYFLCGFFQLSVPINGIIGFVSVLQRDVGADIHTHGSTQPRLCFQMGHCGLDN